jgi:hypothetical protein
MQLKSLIFVFSTVIATLFTGCAGQPRTRCEPMLFPFVEYDYYADTYDLKDYGGGISPMEYKGRNVELFNLKLNVDADAGWRFEKAGENTYTFISEYGESFSISLETAQPFTRDAEKLHFVGCDAYLPDEIRNTRTDRDFYRDLFLFTEDQLSGDPTLWQLYILWSKNRLLHYAGDLIYFKGENLEAFYENIDPDRDRGDVRNRIVIFPNTIAPRYIKIESNFSKDYFFSYFVNMLNDLNP